jgi:hypothetical protein
MRLKEAISIASTLKKYNTILFEETPGTVPLRYVCQYTGIG